jgi:hypothetical protein
VQTEIAFTLPRGYVDERGVVHRDGAMRLATARDEIEPLRDAEVRRNEAYLSVLLLARTVTCPSCTHHFEVDLTDVEDGRLGE